MKAILLCILATLPVACMKVDLDKTLIYPKITINETNSSYIGYKEKFNPNHSTKEEQITAVLNSRSLYNGSEMMCDLTGKLYIIKSEYKSGTVAIKQEGLTCRFEVVEEYFKTHNPDDKKITIHK